MQSSKALEYNDYRNFLNVIEKVKEACVNNRHDCLNIDLEINLEIVDLPDFLCYFLGSCKEGLC